MAVVGPANVMILSGQFPSEMLMRAPLCLQKQSIFWIKFSRLTNILYSINGLNGIKLSLLSSVGFSTTCLQTDRPSPLLSSSSLIHLSIGRGAHKKFKHMLLSLHSFFLYFTNNEMNWSQELTYLSNNTSNFLLKKKEKNNWLGLIIR